MDLTVQNVYGLLIRSRLLPLDESKAMFARWNAEAKDAGNVAQFAKWVVANKYLTEYQASLLARGHADGFFLNQYKVLDRLGTGRMAGVYKARHETGSLVAIKVLPPSKARDPALLGRFEREARVAVRLKHPNVVRTFEVGAARQPGVSEPLHYLVMEYLEGEPFDEVLQRRKQFPPAEAVRLIYQALHGLQHMHEQGLVHRDLKPANLMLAYPPGGGPQPNTLKATVKILDMGLARALAEEVAPERQDNLALTREGIVLGTPDYMSPEQARDPRTADVRSDVYSLGCVLYHLLAGQPPFPDTNIISQMIRHATEPAQGLNELNPTVPDGLQQIVNWMLAKEPARRYPTPARAAQALQVFLAAGAEAEPVAPESDPKMRKYLTWLETDGTNQKSPPAARAPAGDSVPIAKPAPPGAASAPDAKARPEQQPPKSRTALKKKGKKGKKSKASIQLPVARPVAPPAAPDVELVALPPPRPPVQKVFSLPLTRRDLFMFGVGAATVAAGTSMGLLGAWLFGAFKKEASPPEQPPNE